MNNAPNPALDFLMWRATYNSYCAQFTMGYLSAHDFAKLCRNLGFTDAEIAAENERLRLDTVETRK